jgi:uncharacterized protein (DUF433 family)
MVNKQYKTVSQHLMPTNIDFRDIPNYSVSEAAGYLTIPVDRLRSWLARSLIKIPDSNTKLLSFINLVEAHVLRGIFLSNEISLDRVSTAINKINEQFHKPHLLARNEFNLFIDNLGQFLQLSASKQQEMQKILHIFLNRIERDDEGLAVRLFPFTKQPHPDAPKTVKIDPKISFGRPVLMGTGIPTDILAERYKAGESIEKLAEDYNCARLQIEEGIRYQLLGT